MIGGPEIAVIAGVVLLLVICGSGITDGITGKKSKKS